MKPLLPLFIMIDACGWEIIQHDPFGQSFAPYRQRLASVFGYSSTCIPSIVSGRWPDQHRNWCYFVYDPARSPFKPLRLLQSLPSSITNRRIFRRWLTRCLKRPLNFRGYFDLYNLPFKHIGLFDFTEKKNPLAPHGLNCGPNIFDHLEQRQIAYWVSDPSNSETRNLESLLGRIANESIDFAFLYWPGLDGILHQYGNDAPQVKHKLREYEQWIEQLLTATRAHYFAAHLYVFSDHGMANCDETIDLQKIMRRLPVQMPRDYAAVYDSTMARFWFFNPEARRQVTQQLEGVPQGRIVPDEELASLRTLFADRYFGELIFLVKEGVLIVPSHMGERPIRGMHGYHPSDKHSYAALLSNRPNIPAHIQALPDIFELMTEEAELAQCARSNAIGLPNRLAAKWPDHSASGSTDQSVVDAADRISNRPDPIIQPSTGRSLFSSTSPSTGMNTLRFLFSKTLICFLWQEFCLRWHFKFVLPRMTEIKIDDLRLDVSRLPPKARHRMAYVGYETQEKEMCRDFLNAQDSVLELGAAVGFIGLYCQKKIGIRDYLQVEANPRTLEILRRNYQLNELSPNALNLAVAASDGRVELNVDSDFWENSIVPSGNLNEGRKTMEVPSVTLRTLFNQAGRRFNTMIIDVEGAEQFIDFDHMPKEIEKIIMELHPHLIGSEKTYSIISNLICKGFRVAREQSGTFVFLRTPRKAPAAQAPPRSPADAIRSSRTESWTAKSDAFSTSALPATSNVTAK